MDAKRVFKPCDKRIEDVCLDPTADVLYAVRDSLQDSEHYTQSDYGYSAERTHNYIEGAFEDSGPVYVGKKCIYISCHLVPVDFVECCAYGSKYSLNSFSDRFSEFREVHVFKEIVYRSSYGRAELFPVKRRHRIVEHVCNVVNSLCCCFPDFRPVYPAYQVVGSGCELLSYLSPVDFINVGLDVRNKGIYPFCKLISERWPVEPLNDRTKKKNLCAEVISNGFAKQVPVYRFHHTTEPFGYLESQVAPVDPGKQQIKSMQDGIDSVSERLSDQGPVDVIDHGVENPAEGVHVFCDRGSDVLPFNHLVDLCERAVYAVCDQLADAFVVTVGKHLFELVGPVGYSGVDGYILERGSASASATASAASAASVGGEDFQFVESGELSLCFLCGASYTFRGVLHTAKVSDRFFVCFFAGQGGHKHSDVIYGCCQGVDHGRDIRQNDRHDRREGRREAQLQISKCGFQSVDASGELAVSCGYLTKSVEHGPAQPVKQKIQAPDSEAVLQDRSERQLESTVHFVVGVSNSEHCGPKFFKPCDHSTADHFGQVYGRFGSRYRKFFDPFNCQVNPCICQFCSKIHGRVTERSKCSRRGCKGAPAYGCGYLAHRP